MGLDHYDVASLNLSAGHRNLFVRYTAQEGRHKGNGVISEVEGAAIGLTLRHFIQTPVASLATRLRMDKFTGGTADSLPLQASGWNREIGVTINKEKHLFMDIVAFHQGDTGETAKSIRANYRFRY